MRVIISMFFSLFISAVSTISYADNYEAMVNRTVTSFMKQNHIPGAAVVLYVNGQPHFYEFGYANKATQTKVTRNTIFEVGSITKVMTSLLLTQEVDYARMQLTDSVKNYIPELPDTFKNVSLQSLATHTSGLPLFPPSYVKSGDTLNHFLASWHPTTAPDREWQYSSTGIGLLSIALENATQMDINALYIRHILNPLHMLPIGVFVPKKFQPYVAQGYDKNGRPTPQIDMGVFPGAGGVKMSINDMQKFLSAAIGMPNTPVRVLYPMLMTELGYVKLGNVDQGLGWNIRPLNAPGNFSVASKAVKEVIARPFYNGKTLIDKTGSTSGFNAYMAVVPYRKAGIAIFVNKSISTDAIENTARSILMSANKIG